MDVTSLLAAAFLLPVVGACVTVALARRIPLTVLERAQGHGRFANLGAEVRHGGPARVIPVGRHTVARGLRTA